LIEGDVLGDKIGSKLV